MAETQPLVRSDIFDKAFGYTKADEVKALGLYPYFKPLEATDGTIVEIEGHEVIIFLNADAVSLIRPPVLDNLVGLGTGSLKEHFEVLRKAKVPMYVSAISCEIRGVTEQDLKDANARKVFPKTLLNLSLEADRTFVY